MLGDQGDDRGGNRAASEGVWASQVTVGGGVLNLILHGMGSS